MMVSRTYTANTQGPGFSDVEWVQLLEQTENAVVERECPGRERCPKGNRVR